MENQKIWQGLGDMVEPKKLLTLADELRRLTKMYHEAREKQLGITLGLLDIQAEVWCLYKDRGIVPPPEILEFFKP